MAERLGLTHLRHANDCALNKPGEGAGEAAYHPGDSKSEEGFAGGLKA